MMPTMGTDNADEEKPGNPSVAKSSSIKLNDRSNGKPLGFLSEDDWKFWNDNGYVIIRHAVPKEQTRHLADFLSPLEKKLLGLERW